jgi:hypothetical protein
MWLSFAVGSIAAAVAHFVARQVALTTSLVGDEGEYVWRANQPDPFQPRPFLRMPLHPAVGRLAVLARLDPARWLAASCAFASVVTVGLAAAAAHVLGGSLAAAVAITVLLITLERHVFARRRWPDPVLGFWTAALFLTLVADWPALAIGAVLALATATRIDALVMVPAALAALALDDASPARLVAVFAVPSLTVAAITVHNGLRYDLWLPDTTYRFNVSLAAAEARTPTESNSERVSAAVGRWDPERGRIRQVAEQGTSPGMLPVMRGIKRRSITLLGPDVFVREHLMIAPTSRAAAVALTMAVPATVVLAVATAARLNGAYPALLPVLALIATQTAFHTSTRFRQAFLPVLGCLAGVGVASMFERPAVGLLDLIACGTALTVGTVLVVGSRCRQQIGALPHLREHERSR